MQRERDSSCQPKELQGKKKGEKNTDHKCRKEDESTKLEELYIGM